MTSVCTSQQRHMYVSNETANDVSVEHRQHVSVVRLHDILLELCDNVSRVRNISTSPRLLEQVSNEIAKDVSVVRHQDVSVVRIQDVPLVRLYDVSCKSLMKHPITSL